MVIGDSLISNSENTDRGFEGIGRLSIPAPCKLPGGFTSANSPGGRSAFIRLLYFIGFYGFFCDKYIVECNN